MSVSDAEIAAMIVAIDAYQQQHSGCDIQKHPWPDVFGAGFTAGYSFERAQTRSEIAAALEEVAQSTQRWTTLTSSRHVAAERLDAAEQEIERLRKALEEADQAINGADIDYVIPNTAEIIRAALAAGPSEAGEGTDA